MTPACLEHLLQPGRNFNTDISHIGNKGCYVSSRRLMYKR